MCGFSSSQICYETRQCSVQEQSVGEVSGWREEGRRLTGQGGSRGGVVGHKSVRLGSVGIATGGRHSDRMSRLLMAEGGGKSKTIHIQRANFFYIFGLDTRTTLCVRSLCDFTAPFIYNIPTYGRFTVFWFQACATQTTEVLNTKMPFQFVSPCI